MRSRYCTHDVYEVFIQPYKERIIIYTGDTASIIISGYSQLDFAWNLQFDANSYKNLHHKYNQDKGSNHNSI